MNLVRLRVPDSDNTKVSRLGAKFDGAKQNWIVPEGLPLKPFLPWFKPEDNLTHRAKCVYLATTKIPCWKCKATIDVISLVLPRLHERRLFNDWDFENTPAMLNYVQWMPKRISDQASKLNPNFKFATSKAADLSYWMNHCPKCRMKQGAGDLHKVGGAFRPKSAAAAIELRMYRLNEPFEGISQHYSYEVEFEKIHNVGNIEGQ